MTRWLHPPELERQRERDRFDPVVEGARHGLTRELSLAIWERVCADATDGFGRRDTEQAERRFHEIAARIAARGGRLRPDVGRLTRVRTELDGTPRGAWSVDELAPRIPGRETLVAADARRWKAMSAEPAAALEGTEAADRSERDGSATDQHELPHASKVAQALASLLRSSPSDQAKTLDVSEHAAARRRRDVELAAGAPPEREIERERKPRDELPGADEVMQAMVALQHSVRPEQARLLPPAVQSQARRPLDLRVWAPPTRQPAAPEVQSVVAGLRDHLRVAATAGRGAAEALATADPAMAVAAQLRASGATEAMAAQMRRTFGASAGDVAITTDSPRPLAAQAEGVAVGEQVYIAPGFYDLKTTEGRERLGHEVAHVLQQRRGRDLPGRLGAGERAGLEAEADRAGRAFARGERFAVQGRAPAQVALFKGAAPAKAPAATTTTIDLKAGGRIERKAPASDPAASGDAAASPTPAAKDKPKAKEQLIVTYGDVRASNPFIIERDASGEAVRLVGSGTLVLPASTYMKKLDLVISLGPDRYIGAKMQGSSSSTIKIGGLTVHGGTLAAAIDHGRLSYGLDSATISLPKNIGEGTLTMQGNGDQEPAFDASLTINVPKLQPSTMIFHADASGYRAEGSTGVDIKQASGSVNFSLEKVGDDKALWSAAGSVGYTSERLSGQVSVQYNADGELSGDGTLDFKIADFLTGQAMVALDKEGHVTVNGEIRPPNETQLFPEKEVEQTFFHKSVEFPIWGISIPVVGSVGIIAFIDGSMGYRVGVGAGVMRDIVLSGSYSTDPNVQPTFQITGEIFIPAFAELLISIDGGVKLDAFVADIGGGLKVDGRAGFYGGLSVRPTLAYEGGKYRLTGEAILAGDVGLQAQLDAFVKLHVGKWMFSWETEWDWKLGEWDKWLGLNLGMEADLDYTLGQPLSPDIFKLKKPDSLDVQGIAQSAMPKDGMPPQGAKGAQNQHTEFDPKGGAAPASAAAPHQQPNVAGTPAGAAGHKNQDPKGTKVKPAQPPKPGKAKPAKGKGPGQTGPNPKNNSKPTEPKLDATPIVESFNMHGESHQLIVQLGPGGHVDMASKRERLSVKVGHAVSKLIAKHASPEQIADLKEIGALAKKGDKMAVTAKTHDKEGTTKATHQIAAYGAKWEVKDLDEVAIKAPHAIVVTHAVHLEKLPDALNKALGSAHSGQVIANHPGDPKEVTRQLLEKHEDAHFDFPSARLTLPALHPAPLQAAHSVDQLGQLLAQQTGVSKVTLKQTEQKGELKLELIGAIGQASASLGTAEVDAVPKTLVVPKPLHLEKPSAALAKAAVAAHSGQAIASHPGDPGQVMRQLLQRHSDAHFDFPTAKLTLPAPHPAPLEAANSLDQVGEQLAQQTGVAKITSTKTTHDGRTTLEFTGAIGQASAKLGTAEVDALPKTLVVPKPLHLEKPSAALAKAMAAAHSGQVIASHPGDPGQVTRELLQRHSDAHFDFATAKLTLPAPHAAPLEAASSLDQAGEQLAQQTGVAKITSTKADHKDGTTLEFTGAIGEASAKLGTAVIPPDLDLEKPIIATGTMEGEPHKLTVDPKHNKILLASVESDALEKVKDALVKIKEAQPANDTAKDALAGILKTLDLLKGRLDDRVNGRVQRGTAIGNEGMQSQADEVMAQLRKYGDDLGVKDVVELPTFTSDADYERMANEAGDERLKLAVNKWEGQVSGSLFKEDATEIWEGWKLADFDTLKSPAIALLKKEAMSRKATGIEKVRALAGGTSGDLSGGGVKREFHSAVGHPAAEQAKQDGLKKADKPENEAAIKKTHYVPDVGTYGEIETPKGKPAADATLKAAVGSDVIGFLRAMAKDGKANGMILAEFETAWAVPVNRKWVSDEFRDATPKSHEWIPCNKILEVISHAQSGADEARKVVWVELQHALRSPTKNIIFKPDGEYGNGKEKIGEHEVQVLCTHPGNLYVMVPDRNEPVQCTDNHGTWNTKLGELFDPASKSIHQVIDDIEGFFKETVWDGSAGSLPPTLHKAYVNSKGEKIEWQTIVDGQAGLFNAIETDFKNARAVVRNILGSG